MIHLQQKFLQINPGYDAATGLQAGTTYYWEVVPVNSAGSPTGCPVWSFTTLQICSPPTLLATANGVGSTYAICPRGGLEQESLSAGITGGSGCTGNDWQYSWYNGSQYWNAGSFSSNIPVWNGGL